MNIFRPIKSPQRFINFGKDQYVDWRTVSLRSDLMAKKDYKLVDYPSSPTLSTTFLYFSMIQP